MRALEPAISDRFKHAVLLPGWRLVDDPFALGQSICARFLAAGGRLAQQDVTEVLIEGERAVGLRYGDGGEDRFDRMVICAGAWTGKLSRRLGEAIPLETERGYHTQIMAPGIDLSHPITRPSQAFVVAPAAGGIRVGGTVELGGLEAPANYGRAKVLCKRAQDILPELKIEEASEWMGHRPALPDTVPIIGPSAKLANLYYATGHGHLGLTMAATTANLIGELITGETPSLDRMIRHRSQIQKLDKAVSSRYSRSMRAPSRRMPKRNEETLGWFGTTSFLFVFVAILASPGLVWWPLAFVFPVLFTLMFQSIWRQDNRIAESRARDSICDFARSFDYRRIDTWIIRAVYEEFSDSYPIRSKDSFKHDLQIDPEDFENYVTAIAKRVRRNLDKVEGNPLYGKLNTVRDLVVFLNLQPKDLDQPSMPVSRST